MQNMRMNDQNLLCFYSIRDGNELSVAADDDIVIGTGWDADVEAVANTIAENGGVQINSQRAVLHLAAELIRYPTGIGDEEVDLCAGIIGVYVSKNGFGGDASANGNDGEHHDKNGTDEDDQPAFFQQSAQHDEEHLSVDL